MAIASFDLEKYAQPSSGEFISGFTSGRRGFIVRYYDKTRLEEPDLRLSVRRAVSGR